jgi:hypothetical protein
MPRKGEATRRLIKKGIGAVKKAIDKNPVKSTAASYLMGGPVTGTAMAGYQAYKNRKKIKKFVTGRHK